MNNAAFEAKQANYIAAQGIAARQQVFPTICHSVAQAAASAQAPLEYFIKNICMVSGGGVSPKGCVVAIMCGADRASVSTIAKLIDDSTLRIATIEEVLAMTGYPAGGTPSFGYTARFFMDTRVMDLPQVWTGGGSEYALVHSTPNALQAANGAVVAKLRKK